MDLLLLRQAVVLLAGAVSAYTDWKTGLVLDKITYPLIAIGIALNVLEQQWIGLALGMAVLVFGYAFYFTGKIGGGDVKLFTGVAFALPFFGNGIFLLSSLFVGAIAAVVFFTAFFAGKYLLKKGINFKENKQGFLNALMFGAVLLLYLFFVLQLHVLSLVSIIALAVPLLFGLVFLAFERGIRKEFFLKRAKLSELEEDELLATEFEDKKNSCTAGFEAERNLGNKRNRKIKESKNKRSAGLQECPEVCPVLFPGLLNCNGFPKPAATVFPQALNPTPWAKISAGSFSFPLASNLQSSIFSQTEILLSVCSVSCEHSIVE